MPHFGKRVIGEKAYNLEAAKAARGATHFGHRVVGKITEAGEPDAGGDDGKGKGKEPQGISVAKIETLLGENPALLDQLFADELQRPEGARKTALRLFLKVETAKESPRVGYVDHLHELIEGKAE